ncbi:hypothetical protein ACEYW6_10455 [Nostoc sp. UIC 10607]|uniref:hypothetical protein n=1 Tax=Nostoc sp. UIC 10607 TaxID=3045935 RepID=UPI00399F9EC3
MFNFIPVHREPEVNQIPPQYKYRLAHVYFPTALDEPRLYFRIVVGFKEYFSLLGSIFTNKVNEKINNWRIYPNTSQIGKWIKENNIEVPVDKDGYMDYEDMFAAFITANPDYNFNVAPTKYLKGKLLLIARLSLLVDTVKLGWLILTNQER